MLFIGLLSFALSFITTIILILFQKKCLISQFIRSDGPKQHLSKHGTATFGGIAIVLAQFISLVCLIKEPIVLFYLKALLLFFSLGALDDIIKIKKINNGLSTKAKMFLQILITLYLIVQTPALPFIKELQHTYLPFFNLWYAIPASLNLLLQLFAYTGTTNAINFTDGLDGLLTWVLLGVWSCFLFTLMNIQVVIGPEFLHLYLPVLLKICSSVLGSLFGFLCFNAYRASIFMGDCGSLALGGSLCSLFCLFQAPLLLLGILIVPVLETVSVIIQIASYRLTGKRFFKMAPIHHHFEQLDYHESHITTRFFLLNTFCCILTLSSLLPR